MELILWRHAEAEPGFPDAGRVLTAKGKRQARKMAEWLDRKLPPDCRILCSPATRTMQTAEALGRKFKTHPDFFTDTTPERLLAAAGWPDGGGAVLVVGHQPTLGQAAALLMTGTAQAWPIRKAAVWWFGQKTEDGQPGLYLKGALAPGLL